MSHIQNFDRDLIHYRFAVPEVLGAGSNGASVRLSSDGVVYDDAVSQCCVDEDAIVLAGGNQAFGVHIIGPDETDGSVYRLRGYGFQKQVGVVVTAFIGIGAAAPTVSDVLPLAVPLRGGGRWQSIDECIMIQPFGTIDTVDYSDRPLVFGFKFANESDSIAATANVEAFVSVQRLATRPPFYNASVR